jgi:hypothetical protein
MTELLMLKLKVMMKEKMVILEYKSKTPLFGEFFCGKLGILRILFGNSP